MVLVKTSRTKRRLVELLYVENDPALRGLIAGQISRSPEIGQIVEFDSGEPAVELAKAKRFDVALIDVALGSGAINGIAVGIALRKLHPHIGIVSYSQHSLADITKTIPADMRDAWSVIPKRANMNLQELVSILLETAKGHSIIGFEGDIRGRSDIENELNLLSPRQRQVIAMASNGFDAKYIADNLAISVLSVRQEFSKIYSVLVPNAMPGTDLRTSAVLRYLRLSAPYGHYVD